MGQWGFATNNANMEASIAACVVAMEGDGWALALGRGETRAKVQEMLLDLRALAQGEWSVLKRVAIHPNFDTENAHLPKRVCIGPKPSAFLDTGATVIQAPTEQGSVIQPPLLQNPKPSTSNQHVSSEKDSSVPGETPSSTTPCNDNLLDVGAVHDTEILAIAHAAAAESLALNGGCELPDIV